MKLALSVSYGEHAQAMKHHELYHCPSPPDILEMRLLAMEKGQQ
jgi:hypothetical protein